MAKVKNMDRKFVKETSRFSKWRWSAVSDAWRNIRKMETGKMFNLLWRWIGAFQDIG